MINRPQRANRSPGPGPQPAGRNSPGNAVTSMVRMNLILSNVFFPPGDQDKLLQLCSVKSVPLDNDGIDSFFFFKPLQLSPSFTPTSVIRKMYATKEKSRDDPSSHSETKEEGAAHSQDGMKHQFVLKETPERLCSLYTIVINVLVCI